MWKTSALARGEPSDFSLLLRDVATEDELETLSTEELHDRASHWALRHGDVRFFWRLMRALPAAEAAAGEDEQLHDDIQSVYGRFNDLRHSAEGDVGELMRPMYIDYLLKHPKA